ncbi:MAG: ATP-binding protein [Magnetococcales bacterium]|nr:ATP-binding protein [Magnetococcales bacterium]MBF0323428.1 ATP-binding protein [Magnetococcales bacterium]
MEGGGSSLLQSLLTPRRARTLLGRLQRLLEHWERSITPPSPAMLQRWHVFRWRPNSWGGGGLVPVETFHPLPLDALLGIDRAKEILLRNTRQFAAGLPANNALLWGSRGTGKSSLVKAVAAPFFPRLKLVEVHKDDLSALPEIVQHLQILTMPFLLFCDDLSFDRRDGSYKALKSILEGGVAGRPGNILLYATSNRRHLMARDAAAESEEYHPMESAEEQISLSDRFGLWLGFHPFDQETYLRIVENSARHLALAIPQEQLCAEALAWAQTRGARSGRVAHQFIIDLTGRLAAP